jgi:predicted nucleic acid-binding Zn ribbon protein
MERLSKLIRGLRLPGEVMTESDLACAAWAQAVGKRIAAHTRAAKLVRRRLVVEVEDRIWQQQLFVLSYQIVRNLERHLGPDVIEDLEFRVVPRRREPRRAVVSAVAVAADEADAISDPVLRGIYKASRTKALA